MRTTLIVVFVIASLVAMVGIGCAQRGGGGMMRGQGPAAQGQYAPGLCMGLGMGTLNGLNLSQSQISRIQAIRSRYITDTAPLRQQLQARSVELADLWTAPNPSRTAIKNKIAQMDTIRDRLRNAMVDRTFDVMDVLTSAQKAQLRTMARNQPGYGMGMGYGLGMGCNPYDGGCYMMGPGMTTADPSSVSGKTIFDDNCAVCHGATGTKVSGWKSAVKKMTQAQVESVVRNGRDGMPAFGSTLTSQQIQAVAAYAKQLAAQ